MSAGGTSPKFGPGRDKFAFWRYLRSNMPDHFEAENRGEKLPSPQVCIVIAEDLVVKIENILSA